MDRADKAKPRDPMSDVVFSGCRPPAPEPVPEPVRRDSMGRLIHETALEALKKTQFKPGQSGYPGGNFKRQREHAMAVVMRLIEAGQAEAVRHHRGFHEPDISGLRHPLW